jgi:hypothetical protein
MAAYSLIADIEDEGRGRLVTALLMSAIGTNRHFFELPPIP